MSFRLLFLALLALPLAACDRGGAPAPPPEAEAGGGGAALPPAEPESATGEPAAPATPPASPPATPPAAVPGAQGEPPVIRTGDPSEPASRGRMVVARPFLDLGKVEQEVMPLRYPFRIEGDDPVTVTAMKPSCGCTEAHVEVGGERWPLGRALEPGTEGEVVATFDARRFQHEKQSSVELIGEGANLPLTLRFRADVQPTFQVEPPALRLGRLPGGTPELGAKRWEVRVRARRPFHIQEWKELPRGVQVEELEVKAEEAGGEVHLLEVRLDPDIAVGPLFGNCVAATDLDLDLRFLVQGTIEGPVRFLPAGRIWFGLVDQGQSPTRQLRIQSNREGLELPEPEVLLQGDPVFTVEAAGGEPGRELRWRVRLAADAVPGPHRAMLVVRFPEESGIPEHRVPVDATVRVRR